MQQFLQEAVFPIAIIFGLMYLSVDPGRNCLVKALAGLLGIAASILLLLSVTCDSHSGFICTQYARLGASYRPLLHRVTEAGLTITIVANLVTAVTNIVVGSRRGDTAQGIAGALCGLMAMASTPAVTEPTFTAFAMDALGLAIGLDALILRGLRGSD